MLNRVVNTKDVGGDVVQMVETKVALERLGVVVDIEPTPEGGIDDYDVVHLFNLTTQDTHVNWTKSIHSGIPMVISSIYWNSDEFMMRGWSPAGSEYMNSLLRGVFHHEIVFNSARMIKDFLRNKPMVGDVAVPWNFRSPAMLKRILESCVCVLPNSLIESEMLQSEFSVPAEKVVVVPNAVSPIFLDDYPSKAFESPFGEEDFVLSVARIEDRKNTMRLIRACRDLAVPLVLIGKCNPRSQYARSCIETSRGGRVCFYGELPPRSELLISAYSAAKVHALVSWYETPGLSTLEAAAVGCRIVSTIRGCAREYFGDSGIYVDPRRVESIEAGIRRALEEPPGDELSTLRKRIREKYTWENAAAQTKRAYELAIARS